MIQQYKTLFTVALLAITGIAANAQRLPNVQQGSLRAPVSTKVDGKATEWKNEFKAYNHATDIFYTISNDDEYLYLTAKATDPEIIRRIMNGGIALTIQKSGKKDDQGGVCVTYPVIDSKLKLSFNTRKSPDDETLNEADSIMKINNQKFIQNAKWIGITGIAGLDSLISVYNEDGVKAAGLFDDKKAFTCEIAVALNQPGVSVAAHPKIAYHVLLNGFNVFNQKVVTAAADPRSMGSPANYDPVSEAKLNLEQTLTAPTDFWGEYTLTKK